MYFGFWPVRYQVVVLHFLVLDWEFHCKNFGCFHVLNITFRGRYCIQKVLLLGIDLQLFGYL